MPRNGSATSSRPATSPPASLMTDRSSMSRPPISTVSNNAIFSPASVHGAEPCAMLVGWTPSLFGPAPALVSHSARPASSPASTIRAISGPCGSASSRSAALASSLASRLQARCIGSTLFVMTSKEQVTPSGRRLFLLRASARRTSDNGSISRPAHWATPTTTDATRGAPETFEAKKARGAKTGSSLIDLAAWATPAHRDYRAPNLKSYAERGGKKKGEQLPNLVAHGGAPIGCNAETERPGQLNPAFCRWLMGLPPVWDDCAPTETRSRLRRQPRGFKPIERQ